MSKFEEENFDENLSDEELFGEEIIDEEDAEDDDGDAKTRTVLLTKNEMVALLSLKTIDDAGGIIVRLDPREEKPSWQNYESASDALRWFKRSINTSRKNGWRIVYDGAPLRG